MCPPVASKSAVVFLTDLSISTFLLWQLSCQQAVNMFHNKMDSHIQTAKVRSLSVCMCLYAHTCVCTRACVCVYAYVCACACACMCVCVYACEFSAMVSKID